MVGDRGYTAGSMPTLIALLRGINVGGHSRLSMKDLVVRMEKAGARDVKTYIQSGNAVFQASARSDATFARALASNIHETHGFKPHVLVLTLDVLTRAMANNPFPEAEAEPKSLHLGFLSARPRHPDIDALDCVKRDSERFGLIGSVFYLHAPDGVARSKLAASAERLLGVPMTSRNWKTVCKIRELAVGSDA